MKVRWQTILGWCGALVVIAFATCVIGGKPILTWLMSPAGPITVTNWPGGKVERQGTYTLTSGEQFKVWMEPNGVHFKLTAADGRVMVVSDINTSQYQRWALYVDSRKWVWLESSDIGGYVWQTDQPGECHYKGIHGNKELQAAMPKGFRDD